MRIKPLLILILLNINASAQQSTDTILQRIIIVGDAGQLTNGHQPELELVRRLFPMADSNNTVVYLGDNIYPVGMPAKNSKTYDEKKRILDLQIDLLKGTSGKGYIIPGNHDWKQGRTDGLQQLKHQEDHVNERALPNVFFTPADGCPGPDEIPLNASVTMIVVDSQWWLQRENKPGSTSDCECKTEDEIVARLRDLIYKNRNKLVIFATHHPFKTYGEHGGYYTWKQHLFPLTEMNHKLWVPLPVLGSVYAISRGVFGNIQDVKHPEYKDYISKLDTVLSTHPYCIRISGHEHTLQYIQQNGQNYIVSGAASKQTQVRNGKGTIFKDEGTGFGVIEILNSGKVLLKFFSSESQTPEQPLYSGWLKSFDPKHDAPEITERKTFTD
ncbi:MAG: metallophosphoesterase [Flavitalea sp.]